MLTFHFLFTFLVEVMSNDPSGVPAYAAIQHPIPKIQVDGRLTDAVWRMVPRTKNFKQNKTGKSSTNKNWAKIFYDESNLYIGLYTEDNKLSASLAKHDDDIFREDVFEIFLAPDGVGREYLEIEISPLNTIYDAWVIFKEKNIDLAGSKGFDFKKLEHAVFVEKKIRSRENITGWSAELAIPLDELPQKTSIKKDTPWLMNITRVDKDSDEKKTKLLAWSPTGGWFHIPSKFGKLFFITQKELEKLKKKYHN